MEPGRREATGGWWPTWEDNLSNLICAFLREHLAEQKPVINREVEIQPSSLDGGRTDVHVQATDPRDAASQPLTVIIEVKGCWNPEITTGIRQQLLPYLQPRPGWAGIFLVGYFHQPGDEHENYRNRHRTTMNHIPEQILHDLQQQIGKRPRPQHHACPCSPTAPHPAIRARLSDTTDLRHVLAVGRWTGRATSVVYLSAPGCVKRLRLGGRSTIVPGGSPAAKAPLPAGLGAVCACTWLSAGSAARTVRATYIWCTVCSPLAS